MCLAVITADHRGRLVICANRDEYHDRPTEPLHWWPDVPGVAGGRASMAGGSWLAVHRTGRFALVLNGRDGGVAPAGAPSRGSLAVRFLTESGFDANVVAAESARFAGFHWLGGDRTGVAYVGQTQPGPRWLEPGVVTCGNWGLDPAGPRLRRASEGVAAALDEADPVARLFDILADDTPLACTPAGNGNGDTRPVFIRGEAFGTR